MFFSFLTLNLYGFMDDVSNSNMLWLTQERKKLLSKYILFVIPSPAFINNTGLYGNLKETKTTKHGKISLKIIQNLIIINVPSIHSFQNFEVRFKQVAFIFHDFTVLNRLIIQLHREEKYMTELLFYYFKPEIKIRTVTNISSCRVHAIGSRGTKRQP